MTRASPESGMTLVELLVGLVLLSFLALMLTGSLRFSIRAWERSDVHREDLARIQSTQNLIRRYLGEARPDVTQARTAQAKDDRQLAFVGGPDGVEFVSTLPAHLGSGGLYRIVLDKAAASGGNSGLRIRWRPDKMGLENSLGEGDVEWRETILLSTIKGLKFSYFGNMENNSEADWFESWESAQAIPGMVRLSVDFPDDDPRFWPDLTVRLMLKTSGRP